MANRPPDLALKGSGCRYVSKAASSAVTNTTTETTMDSFAIPAGELAAGDVIEVIAQGIATATNGTDTLTIKLKIGSSVFCATAAVDVADNDTWYLHAHVTIRTDGASGTLVGSGIWNLGVEGTATTRGDILASTAVDTTAAQTVACTATWSAASASDSCRNDAMIIKIHHPYSAD